MKVKIKKLTFNCIIGILPIERQKEQKVVINCSFKYKYKKSDFIDYSNVAEDIVNTMIKRKFELLEDAILELKKFLNTKYNMKKLKISIQKPDIMPNCKVSITL
ncbi:dihydroneopterin aldolase [uncultured Arcobacter sp.]|uniref:dihydroneopterin aldolase n=1 Tax=uncultured Arcobacter sp. TaxID=165434 RepID=UPI002629EE72|nr:dihydroneopterin aldolase [uncultured Arcobacter sp.]